MHDNNKGDAAFTIPIFYQLSGQYATFSDPKFDTRIDEALDLPPDKARTKAFQEIFSEVHDRIAVDIPMFHMIGYTRVGKAWTGAEHHDQQRNPARRNPPEEVKWPERGRSDHAPACS